MLYPRSEASRWKSSSAVDEAIKSMPMRSWQKSKRSIPSSSASNLSKIPELPATWRYSSGTLRTLQREKPSTKSKVPTKATFKMTGTVSMRGWHKLYLKWKTLWWKSSSAVDEATKSTPMRFWQKSKTSIPTSLASTSSKIPELPATWRLPSSAKRTQQADKLSTPRKAPTKATFKMTGTVSALDYQQP